jgi:hypothetical protein
MNRWRILVGGGALALAGAGAAAFSVARMGSMEDYAAEVAAARAPLSQHSDVMGLIRYATLAANTPPWRFHRDPSGFGAPHARYRSR